jgi:hypothetical protein
MTGVPPKGSARIAIPDYCNDLNAMHEAEKFLLPDDAMYSQRNLSPTTITEEGGNLFRTTIASRFSTPRLDKDPTFVYYRSCQKTSSSGGRGLPL